MLRIPTPLRIFTLTVLLGGLVACGGLTGGEREYSGSRLLEDETELRDVAAKFKECFATDMAELTTVLDLFEGFLGEDGRVQRTRTITRPEIDLLGGLLNGGDFDYTWDLNDDGVSEIAGTIRFVDERGGTTLPFDVVDLLRNPPESIQDVLALVRDRAQLEFSYEVGGLLLSAGKDASGAGKLVFQFAQGALSTVSGSGAFDSGTCLLDFSFQDIDVSLNALDGIPAANFEFDATVDEDSLFGSFEIGLDGVAVVTAQLNDDPRETFQIDLNAATRGE